MMKQNYKKFVNSKFYGFNMYIYKCIYCISSEYKEVVESRYKSFKKFYMNSSQYTRNCKQYMT